MVNTTDDEAEPLYSSSKIESWGGKDLDELIKLSQETDSVVLLHVEDITPELDAIVVVMTADPETTETFYSEIAKAIKRFQKLCGADEEMS